MIGAAQKRPARVNTASTIKRLRIYLGIEACTLNGYTAETLKYIGPVDASAILKNAGNLKRRN